MRTHNTAAIAAVMAAVAAAPALGSIVEYTDFGAWSSAVGPFTTLDFTDLAHGEVVDTQFAEFGISFGDTAIGWHSAIFPLDGRGIQQAFGKTVAIEFTLSEARTDVAMHFPAGLYFVQLIAGETVHHLGVSGLGSPFWGVQSDQPFDRVRVLAELGLAKLDDLHFGVPIPAPAGAVLLGLAGLVDRRRRRVR